MLKPGLSNSAPFGNATKIALPDSTTEFDQVAQGVIKDLQDGTRSFLSAAKGIKTIHDQKLYLSRYATFDECCQQHFQISRSFAYRKLAALAISESLGEMSPIGDIRESHLRELADVSPAEAKEIVTILTTDNVPITAKSIKEQKAKMNEPTLPAPKPRPGKEPVSVSERIEAIRYNNQLSDEEKWDMLISIDWSRFKLTP